MNHSFNDKLICVQCGFSQGMVERCLIKCVPLGQVKCGKTGRISDIKFDITYNKIYNVYKNIMAYEALGASYESTIEMLSAYYGPVESAYWYDLYLRNKVIWEFISNKIGMGVLEGEKKWIENVTLTAVIFPGKGKFKLICVNEGDQVDILKIFRSNFMAYKFLFHAGNDIFHDEVDTHLKYFFPFALLPLDLVIPGEKQLIPFVIPFESCDGFMGARLKKFHSYYSRENWIGFDLINGKLKFDTDWSYFDLHQIKHCSVGALVGDEKEEVVEQYREVLGDIKSRIKKIKPSKNNVKILRALIHQNVISLFNSIGYEPEGGNWKAHCLGGKDEVNYGYLDMPLDHEGNEMIFLGSCSPFCFSDCYVLGFITRDLKKVVFTLDNS